jgi:hypothetical protein
MGGPNPCQRNITRRRGSSHPSEKVIIQSFLIHVTLNEVKGLFEKRDSSLCSE